MAALRTVCFSSLFNSPFIYPSLCAHHRRLWTSVSIHSAAYFSSSARWNKQEALESYEEGKNVISIENTPSHGQASRATSKTYDVEDSFVARSEPVYSAAIDGMSKSDKSTTDVTDAHITEQEKDITKSRSNNPKNQKILYERLPARMGDTDIQFTIGKRRMTLKTAKSALDKWSLENESLIDDVSKVGGANYFGDLLKPSFQTKRSRTNPPSVDTVKLLKHISKSHELSQKDTELYSASLPSLLGVTIDNISDTSAELGEAGFDEDEIDQLLALFPHILDVNYENVYKVYCLFKEYLQHSRWIHGLMRRYPFLLTLDSSQIKETLDTFQGLGLNAREMSSLFSHFPLVFFTPLSEETLARIKESRQAGLSSQWLSKALLYTLRFRPARAELGDSASLITEILREYQIDVGEVLVKYPDLFRHTPDQLMTVIKKLSGKPLYLRMDDIKNMLSVIPEVVCQLEDMTALTAHLNLLSEIFTPSILRNVIHSVKSLVDYRCEAAVKLGMLAREGFTKEMACTLVINSPSVLLQNVENELRPKLRLLLGLPGVTHTVIADSTKRYLQHSLAFIQARIMFAQKHYESLLCCDQLDNLLVTSDDEFASLCGHKTQQFYSQTGFSPLSSYEKFARKRGRPRKKPIPATPRHSEETLADVTKFTRATKNDTNSTRPSVSLNSTLDDLFKDSTKLPVHGSEQRLVNSRERTNREPTVDSLFKSENIEVLDIKTTSDDQVLDQPSDVPFPKFKTADLPPFEMLNYDPQPVSATKTSCIEDSASSDPPNVQSDLLNVQLAPESISPIDMLDSKNDLSDTGESPESLDLTSVVSREIAELLQELRATTIDGLSLKKSLRGVEFVDDSQYWDDFCDDCFDNQSMQMPGTMR